MRANNKQTKKLPKIFSNNQSSFGDKVKQANKKLNFYAKQSLLQNKSKNVAKYYRFE